MVGDEAHESPLFEVVRRVKPVHYSALIAAHRGDSQNAPENTLAAFSRALEAGADLVEFDVHVSQDGDVIVIHDDKVDRTTDGKGEVRKLRTAALKELDAGNWFSSDWRGERIPTLDETLELLKGRAVPLVEIKVKTKRCPDAGRRVVQALERHNMLDQAVVICREPARAQEVRDATPQTPVAYLTYTKIQARGAAKLAAVGGLDIYWKCLSLKLISGLRGSKRLFLTPWTVNRRRDMERLLLLGVESLITDSPTALRDLLDGFEVERAQELLERFEKDGQDVDLERENGGDDAPDEVAKEMGTNSEVDLPSVE